MLIPVVLNALIPGLGHAYLRRWAAAIGWLVGTLAVYFACITALVYGAATLETFDRIWRYGELRVLAAALLPAVLVHTWCCVSVLPSPRDRRLALACAAAAMLVLVALAPPIDLGLERQIDTARRSAAPR